MSVYFMITLSIQQNEVLPRLSLLRRQYKPHIGYHVYT